MRQLAAANPSAGGAATDPLRPRRLFLGGLAIGVVLMSVIGLATAIFIESPHDVAARFAVPPATNITAVARWQVLREAVTVQGAVRSARKIAVTAAAPYATVTITRMPVKAGEQVRAGHVVAEVDGRPVVLLQGRVPAYRDLHEGDQGPDVAQLQRALEALGYADFDPPGLFSESTELALVLFYGNLDYAAPVYHPRPPAARSHTGRQTAGKVAQPSAYLPRSEVVFIPSKSALVTAVNARVGDLVRGSTVLTLATGHPYISAELSLHQAAAIRRGMHAEILTATAHTFGGAVTAVSPAPVGGRAGASGYRVLIKPMRAMPQSLIGSAVRLTLLVPVTSVPVLTVPAAAIVLGRHGATGVITIGGGRRSRVAVDTGPSADGVVAVQPVRPGALRPGDRVLIGTSR